MPELKQAAPLAQPGASGVQFCDCHQGGLQVEHVHVLQKLKCVCCMARGEVVEETVETTAFGDFSDLETKEENAGVPVEINDDLPW